MQDKIKKAFLESFPKGYINLKPFKPLGGGDDGLSLTIGLIGDIDHVRGNIRENDPMLHKFLIYKADDTYTAVLVHGCLYLKSANPLYAMETCKTGFRKSAGNGDKIVKVYNNFFKKLKNIVDSQKTNVHNFELYKDYITIS